MPGKSEQDDQALLDELAGLIERLRSGSYAQVVQGVRDAPATGIDEFMDLLSRHLLYEENILFPSLRESAAAGAVRQLGGLEQEHGELRGFARDFVRRVREGDVDGACKLGRLFMAALLDHMDRESEITRKALAKLAPAKASRLRRALQPRRRSVS
jgi:hemerythrin-like domain-containing protein